jgi:hypothetical protein
MIPTTAGLAGFRDRRLPAAVAIATLLSAGCASSATILRPDGPPIEATITDSDESNLYVQDQNGNLLRIGGQYNVSEIDHPGNVVFAIGLPYLAVGVGLLAAMKSAESGQPRDTGDAGAEGQAFGYLIGWTSLISGGALVAAGGLSWLRSKRAARRFEAVRPPDFLLPPPAPMPPWRVR